MRAREINITVAREATYLKIRTEASYKGSKSLAPNDEGAYDRISIAEEDAILLDKLWDECIETVVRTFSKYIKGAHTNNSTGFSALLIMPTNFDSTQVDSMASIAQQYIVNHVLSKWYDLASPKDVDFYMAQATAKLAELQDALASRLRPMRVPPQPYPFINPTIEFEEDE